GEGTGLAPSNASEGGPPARARGRPSEPIDRSRREKRGRMDRNLGKRAEPRWVVRAIVVLAALAATLGGLGLSLALRNARAAAAIAPCAWPLQTGGSGRVNVAYPDTNSTYWTMPYSSALWRKMVLHGTFPQIPTIRYMSVTTYDQNGDTVDNLYDVQIQPDA